jgi:large subunit ribosomal protein L22
MANETLETMERPREHRENRKKNLGRKVADNQARAVAKFLRVPPRKARLVMDEIRGRYALDALAFLKFIPNRAAEYIRKVLESAVANAANNHDLTTENLKLVEARVDEGPRMKRVQPRAQGRAYRILKRMSHITVVVQEVEPKPKKPRKTTGSRAQAARAARQTQAAPAPKPVATAAAPEATKPVVSAAPAEEEKPATAETVAMESTTPETPVTENTEPQEANTEATTDETGAPQNEGADAKE